MNPYSALTHNTPHTNHHTPTQEVNLSLMISMGALRLVNRVERSIAQIRRR